MLSFPPPSDLDDGARADVLHDVAVDAGLVDQAEEGVPGRGGEEKGSC